MKHKHVRSFLSREINDLRTPDIWRASVAEWLGLLLITLFGSGAGLYHEGNPTSAPSSVHVALETGFMIGCLVTIFGTVSGGHVNPTITIGFAVTREITVVRTIFYIAAQTLGGICGSGILHLLTPHGMQQGTFGLIMPGKDVTDTQALVTEFLIGFFLLFGTFAVIDKGRDDLQGSMPLMIGLMVSINVFFAVGNIWVILVISKLWCLITAISRCRFVVLSHCRGDNARLKRQHDEATKR